MPLLVPSTTPPPSENSLCSPLSSPTTIEIDLSYTSNQLSHGTPSASISGGPLYDEIHPRENCTGVPNEFDPTGPLLTPPTTPLLSSRSETNMKSDTCISAGSPLYSEPAPPVLPRTDEMMELSEDSLSLPLISPTTVETDLSSTSSDQLRDEQTSASVSGDPLYDEIHLAGTVVQSQSNGNQMASGEDSSGPTHANTKSVVVQSQSNDDHTMPSGVSSGPTYAQPMHPTFSENTVSAPPATEPVVYDEVDKFQNSQVSKMAVYMQVDLMKFSLHDCACVYLTHFRVSSTLCWKKCPHLTENQMT